MKDTLESIAAVLQDAEKQSIKKESVRLWLKRLKHASFDISDMMDDYQETNNTQAKAKIGMFSRLTAARKKMLLANKMKNMREKLERINKERRDFTFTETNTASQDQQLHDGRETTSDVKEEGILGRDREKKDITELLSSSHSKDGVMVLPIYGLGGMGKSTMAKLIYNDTQFKQYYDHRVWVYVSQEFDLMKIGKSILSQLPNAGQQNRDTLQSVQQCLNDLVHGKKILIILDDIWEEDNFKLKDLKDMLDKKGSMIDVIVTTRSETIANKICTNKAYKLQPLEDDVCWDIIKRHSGFKEKSNQGELQQIGLDIAKKCGGVPLAAQAVGYMLSSKDLHGWIDVNNSVIWNESSGIDNSQDMKVLASLKLTYERMQPILRLCFSYCAIFPKGYDIFEDDLVHQWFALDFIKNPSKGKEYIKQLLGMSFLQDSELHKSAHRGSWYTMHDLVHYLATSVFGDELTVIDAAKKSNHTGQQKYCRYAVLTNYDGQTKLSNILPKKVRALHFSSGSKFLDPRDGSFSFAKCLRVLDFSGCPNITLPFSIGQLKQLRCLLAPEVLNEMPPASIAQLSKLQYLNLRESFQMSALPESTSLQYLNISFCSGILNSPKVSFGGLKSLTHLNMSWCSETTVLPESLGELKSLTHLDMSWCYETTVLESLGELKSLTHLNMSWCYGITVLPESFGGLKNLTHLDMPWCYGITVLPESFGELKSLTHLNMSQCYGITVLPESFGGLKNLTHLDMSWCYGITVLPESFGELKNLRHLDMTSCYSITVLPESLVGLKSLKLLQIHCNLELKQWCESEENKKKLAHINETYCD